MRLQTRHADRNISLGCTLNTEAKQEEILQKIYLKQLYINTQKDKFNTFLHIFFLLQTIKYTTFNKLYFLKQ